MGKRLTILFLSLFFVVATFLLRVPVWFEVKAQSSTAITNTNRAYEILQLPAQYSTNYGAKAINDKGELIGNYWIPPNPAIVHAMLWRNGVFTDLGTLGGDGSAAIDINNQSDVVGSSDVARTPDRLDTSHAFVWRDGQMIDLGTLRNGISAATSINNSGHIVGYVSFPAPLSLSHAVLWDHGTIVDLGTGPFSSASATGINDVGQIIGVGTPPGSRDSHGFLWQRGVMTDLGTLGGSVSNAKGINNRGQIVGVSTTAAGDYRAFVWESGVMRDLGTIAGCIATPGCSGSDATDINDSGVIVGQTSIDSAGRVHAFLWKDGTFTDLGTPFVDGGPNNSFGSIAYGVNNRRQVVGMAFGPPGEGLPLLWSPRIGEAAR